jgi:hypothetical protein
VDLIQLVRVVHPDAWSDHSSSTALLAERLDLDLQTNPSRSAGRPSRQSDDSTQDYGYRGRWESNVLVFSCLLFRLSSYHIISE